MSASVVSAVRLVTYKTGVAVADKGICRRHRRSVEETDARADNGFEASIQTITRLQRLSPLTLSENAVCDDHDDDGRGHVK